MEYGTGLEIEMEEPLHCATGLETCLEARKAELEAAAHCEMK